MTVEVISKGAAIETTCHHCRSHLSFEPKDATLLPFSDGSPGGTYTFMCPVCTERVFKTITEAP